MQSAIILAIMVLSSFFLDSEYLRNDGTEDNAYKHFKAQNVSDNILQYHDQMMKYALESYENLHLLSSINPSNVEQIELLDYGQKNIADYTLKNFTPFLNYSSVVFNYTKNEDGESHGYPILYLVTSWESYTIQGYRNIQMSEAVGNLAQDITKHLYQGNSTFWVVPWVFKQSNCYIDDLYTQLANDEDGASTINKLKSLFNSLCTKIESGSKYKFSSYVFLEPVINNPDF